jgi:hypothetical protein
VIPNALAEVGKVVIELITLVRVHENALNVEEQVLGCYIRFRENFFDSSTRAAAFVSLWCLGLALTYRVEETFDWFCE